MHFLMLILSVMTFTVKDKNTVTADGTWPYSMEASYHCTYQKGTVRANDTATLVVSGLDGLTIQSTDVYLRSNKSAGGGELKAFVNGNVVSTKSGTLEEWVGSYDKDNFHPIRIIAKPCKEVNQVKIQLIGTTNSLYIEKYVFQCANASARMVTLMSGDEVFDTMTEDVGGGGVVLPEMEDKEHWAFVGWSGSAFQQTTVPPEIIPAGTYYPHQDETLWAVYRYHVSMEECVATDIQSGVYIYANTADGTALSGMVEDGNMYPTKVNLNDENQYYYIAFDGTGTKATLMHLLSETYIGYTGTQLVYDAASEWCVYHDGTRTALYIVQNGSTYVLWQSFAASIDDEPKTKLVLTNDLSVSPTVLYDLSSMPEEPVYTCYPAYGLGLEQSKEVGPKKAIQGIYRFPFGPYDLIIENGVKGLEIRD